MQPLLANACDQGAALAPAGNHCGNDQWHEKEQTTWFPIFVMAVDLMACNGSGRFR